MFARRGMRFQTDAKTSRPTPAYVSGAESSQNFPTTTLLAAIMPIQNGRRPRRLDARNASAPTATARKATVTGSKYVVETRNPRPSDESTAAYAGEQTGQITLGSIDTPTPGTASAVSFQVRLAIYDLMIKAPKDRTLGNRTTA